MASSRGNAALAAAGFRIEVDSEKAAERLQRALAEDAALVRSSAIGAVRDSVEALKGRVRDFVDAIFTGSALVSNNRRRISNTVRSVYFEQDIEEKGQFGGLIYSKFGRGKGPETFVDFLLMHFRGGTIRPDRGEWLRIPNLKSVGSAVIAAQTGRQAMGSEIFFTPRDGGRTLLQLRKKGNKIELIATLVKEIKITPKGGSIDALAAARQPLFEANFDRRLAEGGVE